MAICRLCLQERELIKKSHIIPEFMYAGLYDEKHKINRIVPKQFVEGKGFVMKPSSGEYQGNLLCANCDNKVIGQYEDYARKTLYGGHILPSERPKVENLAGTDGINFSRCTNINYQKFKIFLLSILWRASISSRAMFNEVELGEHEEVIRKMIFTGSPGEVGNYPIFMTTFKMDYSVSMDIVTHPRKITTKDGFTTYIFIINGTLFQFYITSANQVAPISITDNTIAPTNSMNIVHFPKGKGMDYIMAYYGLNR